MNSKRWIAVVCVNVYISGYLNLIIKYYPRANDQLISLTIGASAHPPNGDRDTSLTYAININPINEGKKYVNGFKMKYPKRRDRLWIIQLLLQTGLPRNASPFVYIDDESEDCYFLPSAFCFLTLNIAMTLTFNWLWLIFDHYARRFTQLTLDLFAMDYHNYSVTFQTKQCWFTSDLSVH